MINKKRKTTAILVLAVVFMFGFSFALVPLYRIACKKIGLNTSTPVNNMPETEYRNTAVVANRDITVQFFGIPNQGLPWDFRPDSKTVKIHPGENTRVTFYAKNNSKEEMVVQAVPSMTPAQSIRHFHKIECFCFNQQTLKAGEAKNMVLVFQVDKDIPKDVHTISLAYTLFDATPKIVKTRS